MMSTTLLKVYFFSEAYGYDVHIEAVGTMLPMRSKRYELREVTDLLSQARELVSDYIKSSSPLATVSKLARYGDNTFFAIAS